MFPFDSGRENIQQASGRRRMEKDKKDKNNREMATVMGGKERKGKLGERAN